MNDKVKGAIYGLLIGDAVAAPYEFRDAQYLASLPSIDMIPSSIHRRTYKEARAGSWSDEGSMMLCMMQSLVDCKEFKAADYMKKLASYYVNGTNAVNNVVFGCSLHFEKMMKACVDGGKLYQLDTEGTNRDSQTLSRCLPLAIFDAENDAKSTIRLAHAQAMLTNKNLVNGICAAVYMQWIKNIINGKKNPFIRAVNELLALYNDECRNILLKDILKRSATPNNDTVGVLMDAFYVLSHATNYNEAIVQAVLMGGQTTALASCVGSIAGLIYGYRNIFPKWKDLLRDQEYLAQEVEKFDEILMK